MPYALSRRCLLNCLGLSPVAALAGTAAARSTAARAEGSRQDPDSLATWHMPDEGDPHQSTWMSFGPARRSGAAACWSPHAITWPALRAPLPPSSP